MKMRTFHQHKLCRNKIIEILEEKGSKITWRLLVNDTEYDKELRIKLVEEAEEINNAQSSTQLIEELADIYEVIDSLRALHNITTQEIHTLQEKKRQERGDFTSRIFIETASHQEGSISEKYCLADPKKYPEIVDKI